MSFLEFTDPGSPDPFSEKSKTDDIKKGDCKDWRDHFPKCYGEYDIKWNHKLVKFPEAIAKAVKDGKLETKLGHEATDINVFQLDTGYSTHPALLDYAGYNLDSDLSKTFVPGEEGDGQDRLDAGFLPDGHATNTAFTFVGVLRENDGILRKEDYKIPLTGTVQTIITKPLNEGLFPYVNFVPVRVARNVFLTGKKAKSMYEAVKHAVDKGADVITMAMAGPKNNTYHEKAAKYAYENGVIFVCAAGQLLSDSKGVMYPAKLPQTIAAAGIQTCLDEDEAILRHIPLLNGREGPEVDISAPAKWIVNAGHTKKNGYFYRLGVGTSQASIHVSAAASLWLHYWRAELDVVEFQQDGNKWRKTEAFRYALKQSKYVPDYWKDYPNWERDNVGILNVEGLLKVSPADYLAYEATQNNE